MSEPADKEEETLAEGTLMSHLVELRNRLFIVFGSVFGVFLVLFPFSKYIFDIVSEPLRAVLPGGQLIATGTASPVIATLKLSFYLSLMIAMPVVLYQLWAFVAPGLYKKEKRFAFPLLATSILLFYAGLAFAYFVVFPMIFRFLVAFTPESVSYMPDITDYIGFVMMLVLVFGFAFETPVATVLLVWTGLTTVEKLTASRPYVFLGAFVVGMLLTPPDVVSQILLAVPVYLLYELGIIMAKLFKPKPVK
ncbi:MAG: twin-arginine translocase subunit TatC [Gammaproteobacteria bacterium]|nr:twin-arginine translocase subunit TatC [Gammaproteobacteria bacterium]MDH5240545.1 twin-arginine translocase subunit TatC [Gammaproteobacteria bacterium]MDH5261686.1 twin-arginine translocase subunit TatC [Gammaproteobacteria bacterium]MDH5584444.1 twin-arginine translocase subunit TatC [Gammaproteobacteria bacterium]